jgi:hypothetical protein
MSRIRLDLVGVEAIMVSFWTDDSRLDLVEAEATMV